MLDSDAFSLPCVVRLAAQISCERWERAGKGPVPEKLEQSAAEDIGDEVRYLRSASSEKSLLRALKTRSLANCLSYKIGDLGEEY